VLLALGFNVADAAATIAKAYALSADLHPDDWEGWARRAEADAQTARDNGKQAEVPLALKRRAQEAPIIRKTWPERAPSYWHVAKLHRDAHAAVASRELKSVFLRADGPGTHWVVPSAFAWWAAGRIPRTAKKYFLLLVQENLAPEDAAELLAEKFPTDKVSPKDHRLAHGVQKALYLLAVGAHGLRLDHRSEGKGVDEVAVKIHGIITAAAAKRPAISIPSERTIVRYLEAGAKRLEVAARSKRSTTKKR
jgi:hypothetical protein